VADRQVLFQRRKSLPAHHTIDLVGAERLVQRNRRLFFHGRSRFRPLCTGKGTQLAKYRLDFIEEVFPAHLIYGSMGRNYLRGQLNYNLFFHEKTSPFQYASIISKPIDGVNAEKQNPFKKDPFHWGPVAKEGRPFSS
jgi:hypothetical protein